MLNAYNIVFAAFLVGGGQLADLLGRRRVFSFALLAVHARLGAVRGGALAGRADRRARDRRPAGAAVLVPSSLAIVLEAHDARERMHAVALWSAVAALAAGIGPPLGGAADHGLELAARVPGEHPGGRARARCSARRVLVESRAPGRRRMPDLLGGLVLALAIASLVLGVVKGQEWGWDSARVLGGVRSPRCCSARYFVPRSAATRTPVDRPVAAAHPRVRAVQRRDAS